MMGLTSFKGDHLTLRDACEYQNIFNLQVLYKMHYLCATNNKVYKYGINFQKTGFISSVSLNWCGSAPIPNYSDKIWES